MKTLNTLINKAFHKAKMPGGNAPPTIATKRVGPLLLFVILVLTSFETVFGQLQYFKLEEASNTLYIRYYPTTSTPTADAKVIGLFSNESNWTIPGNGDLNLQGGDLEITNNAALTANSRGMEFETNDGAFRMVPQSANTYVPARSFSFNFSTNKWQMEGDLAITGVLTSPSLGTAAGLNVGTGANNVVQLNAAGQLPAVNGSLLTGIPAFNGGTISNDLTITADGMNIRGSTPAIHFNDVDGTNEAWIHLDNNRLYFLGGPNSNAYNHNTGWVVNGTEFPLVIDLPTDNIRLGGNTQIVEGNLSFGSRNGLLIDLYGGVLTQGAQTSTQYFRTNKNFAWFRNGSHSDTELNAGVGGTVDMVLTNGNLGVGVSAPTQKVDVNGNIKALNFIGNGSQLTNLPSFNGGTISNNLFISPTASLAFVNRIGRVISYYNGDDFSTGIQGSTLYQRSDFNFAWYRQGDHNNETLNPGGGFLDMVLTGGKLGVGVSAPVEKVEVNGNVKATNFIGNGSQLTNIAAANVQGQLSEATMPARVPLLDASSKLPLTNLPTAVPLMDANSKIALANLPTGTSANNLVQLNASGQLPAVNGSLLTGLPTFNGGTIENNLTIAYSKMLLFTGNQGTKVSYGNGEAFSAGHQLGTLYHRSNNYFAWFRGGTHNDAALNPGGGTLDMVLASGNLGVGLSAPTQKVDVNGNVKATNFIGNGSQLTNIAAANVQGQLPVATMPTTVPLLDANSKIALANLPTGTSANNLVQLNASGQLPAVNGSLLQGLPTFNGGTISNPLINNGNGMDIRGGAPTIHLFDTDGSRPAWLHLNNNRLFLVSAPYNAASNHNGGWTVNGGHHPLVIDFSNDFITLGGNTQLAEGTLSFGTRLGSLIELHGPTFSQGIQANTMYSRSFKNFAWYRSGTHNDAELNPGGGTLDMVLTNGNLGVGLSAPTQKVDVNGNVKATGFIGNGAQLTGISSTNIVGFAEISNRVSLLEAQNPNAGYESSLGFAGSYTPPLTTTVNSQTYNLASSMNLIGSDLLFTRKDNGLGSTTSLSFKVVNSNSGVEYTTSRIMAFNTTSEGGGAGGLQFFSKQLNNPITERMRIEPSGNVGIGISAPTEKLEVAGTVKATNFIGDGSQLTGIDISEVPGNVFTINPDRQWDVAALTFGSSLYDWSIRNNNGDLYFDGGFEVNGQDVEVKFSRSGNIFAPGRIVINQSNFPTGLPQEGLGALTVAGTTVITNIGARSQLNGGGWLNGPITIAENQRAEFTLFAEDGIMSESFYVVHPCMWDGNDSDCPIEWGDYVFEEDYELKPLDEVKVFLKENKHLPGVPSAVEVMKGYELHDMNKNMIVKIEELTLYTIQQDEAIKVLQAEIASLKELVNQQLKK